MLDTQNQRQINASPPGPPCGEEPRAWSVPAPTAGSPTCRSPPFQLASNFQATARMGTETEAYFTAVERMLQYMKVGAGLGPVEVSARPRGPEAFLGGS